MSNSETIRARDQIPQEDTWALEDLYPSDESWEQALSALTARQAEAAAFAGKLGESGETLCAFLHLVEDVDGQSELLANYAMRKADQDTRNATYQAMVGKLMGVLTAVGAAFSFATPEIMAIPEEALEGFYKAAPGLERYRRYLNNERRRREHTLSAAEERLLAAAGEMANAPETVFGSFLNADMRYPDAVDSEGKPHALSQSTFVPLEESGDRALRKSAYENLYNTLGGMRNTAAGLLDAQNKQQKFFATARKYGSAREAAMDRTNVPVSVYDNLIEAVHRNMDKMHRYVRLRKKLLGVDELHFYDVYTPLLKDEPAKIPFAQAKQTVYDALYPLGDGYRAILKEGFEIVQAETIPIRIIPEITDVPLIWRYFVSPLHSVLARLQLDEKEFVARTVMELNTRLKGAYVFSSGKNMGAFKAVGYPEDVGRFYRLEEYEAYSWTAHGRYPTNTPGWWGGAHPFALLDYSIVHNGEISSYDANRRYIEMFGYKCTLQTDTEVITYIADYLLRRQGLTLEEMASVIAAPFWSTIRLSGGV